MAGVAFSARDAAKPIAAPVARNSASACGRLRARACDQLVAWAMSAISFAWGRRRGRRVLSRFNNDNVETPREHDGLALKCAFVRPSECV